MKGQCRWCGHSKVTHTGKVNSVFVARHPEIRFTTKACSNNACPCRKYEPQHQK